ncbi:MAG: porin, partial [Candidatus Eremiobacteraeota bacterium]|nr:porin [Candidatus Eremiobacteraeota bacterium]
GSAGLKYGFFKVDDSELNQAGLNLNGTYMFSGGASVAGELNFSRLSGDDSDGDVSLLGGRLDGRYPFAEDFYIGAYMEAFKIRTDDPTDDTEAISFGLLGGMVRGPFSFGGYLGKTRVSFDGDSASAVDLGLTLGYEPDGPWAVWALIQHSTGQDDDFLGSDDSLTTLGLAGVYDLGPQWRLFGGATVTRTSGLTLTTFGLGAGYDLSKVSGVPVTLGIELQHFISSGEDDDSLTANSVKLSLTFPFGAKGRVLPAGSLADNVRYPYRSAISGEIFSAS